jgi:hypothetical protein
LKPAASALFRIEDVATKTGVSRLNEYFSSDRGCQWSNTEWPPTIAESLGSSSGRSPIGSRIRMNQWLVK